MFTFNFLFFSFTLVQSLGMLLFCFCLLYSVLVHISFPKPPVFFIFTVSYATVIHHINVLQYLAVCQSTSTLFYSLLLQKVLLSIFLVYFGPFFDFLCMPSIQISGSNHFLSTISNCFPEWLSQIHSSTSNVLVCLFFYSSSNFDSFCHICQFQGCEVKFRVIFTYISLISYWSIRC